MLGRCGRTFAAIAAAAPVDAQDYPSYSTVTLTLTLRGWRLWRERQLKRARSNARRRSRTGSRSRTSLGAILGSLAGFQTGTHGRVLSVTQRCPDPERNTDFTASRAAVAMDRIVYGPYGVGAYGALVMATTLGPTCPGGVTSTIAASFGTSISTAATDRRPFARRSAGVRWRSFIDWDEVRKIGGLCGHFSFIWSAINPPRLWRSWRLGQGQITQTRSEGQMMEKFRAAFCR